MTNSQTYNFNTTNPTRTKFLHGIKHHEWAFVGGPKTYPNESNMADRGHTELL